MAKSEFAAHIGVVPSRITAMIAAGIIGRDALVGEGRRARINVALAMQQISARRAPGQALGNGIATRLELGNSATTPRTPETAELIQLERLEFERRRNRAAAIEEAQRAGKLVPVDDMRRALAEAVREVIGIYDQMAHDLGNELAAKFGTPTRDTVHAVRGIMNAKRALAAEKLRGRVEGLPETIEATL